MARPTGWDVLGLDGDPTPGVVESVQALAKEFGDFAHDVEAAYRSLNSFGSDSAAIQWTGQTADSFKAQYGPLPGRLQKLYTSYSEASDALSAYAPKLQAAQTKADTALRQAQDAHAELQRATTTATSAATELKTAQQNQAANPDQQAVTDAQTAHDSAQTNLNNAKAKMTALTKQANDAYNDRTSAAQDCAKALGHAQSDGIHNKHWWEHVGEALSEWGGKIAEIANDLAPFLDVLALATSWIPGVDVVTAALAEADNIVAIAGTGLETAGDAMQGHFKDALIGAGMLGLQFAGGRLLGKLGKEAEGEAGALSSEERSVTRGAEGNEGAVTAADPVDVITGQMLATDTDVVLPGILPLVLRRAYASGNPNGLRFGPGWSSTLDQRISVNAAGIHFAGDDAQTLHYPLPAGGEEVLPERGPRWPLVWDRAADEIRVTDPWSGLTRRFPAVHFAAGAGQIRDLTVLHDRNDNRIDIRRTADGTPVEVEHSGGYRLVVDIAPTPAGPRISALRMPGDDGAATTLVEYRYDDRGRLAGIVNSTGRAFEYAYDDADRITAWTDRSAFRYSYAYDEAGRVASSTGNGGFLAATFVYDPEAGLTAVTDALGHTTGYHYDAVGHIDRVTDRLGAETRFEHDRYGRLLSRTDALGHRTLLTYDERGDVVAVDHPDGTRSVAEYDGLHNTTRLVNRDGATWRHGYDTRGNLVRSTDPAGAETRLARDGRGAVVAVTDALGHITRLEADAAGLLVAVTSADGAVTRSRRDRFGRITATLHPSGATTATAWTLEGRLLSRTGPDGSVEKNVYNANGQVVQHVGPVGTTGFEYGPFGRVTSRTEPGGTRYDFGYDAELRLTSVTAPTGAQWRYAHDAAGRLVSETDFGSRTVTYAHDAADRLTRRTNGAGQASDLVRDAMGRVVERHTADGVLGFEYDAMGRMTAARSAVSTVAYERDPLGRIVAETVDGRTVAHGYDVLGRAVSRVTPGGARSDWEFDAAGRPAALSTGIGDLVFRHDAAGREVARVLGPGALLAQEYDTAGRLVAQNLWTGDAASGQAADPAEAAAAPSRWRRYSYREDGMPDCIDDSVHGIRRYLLDVLGRVRAVTGDAWNESYAYDALGNLQRAVTPNTPDDSGDREFAGTAIRRAGRTHYEQDEQGRMVRVVRRTLDGRQREWRYAWDGEDRLVEATLPDATRWRYHYDPIGRRTGKSRLDAGGAVAERVSFSWDGARLIEQESTGADGTVAVLTWDYRPDSMRPAAQRRRVAGGRADQSGSQIDEAFHAIVTDLVGTPTELVAPDGTVEWSLATTVFGEAVAVATRGGADCPLRFPGQYRDAETGLSYNLNRYYDPGSGSYLTPDPLGLAPSPNDRGYVLNPLAWSDPLGLAPVSGGAERGAPDFVVGSNGAQDVRNIGRPDGDLVLSGHGGIEAGDGSYVVVPEGTSIAMYSEHGTSIYDSEGHAIETGNPTPLEVYGPGEKLPDYTLFRPKGLTIMGTPRNVTVTGPTRLSELLQPNQGTVHWAACREVVSAAGYQRMSNY